MSRPIKCRRVGFFPQVKYFRPENKMSRDVEEVCLSVEEVEAIRLKDLQGLEQEQAAEQMNISRPTFHRILAAAHQKIAEALFKGKAIRIDGGNFEIPPCHFRCQSGHEWDVAFEVVLDRRPGGCPSCGASEVKCFHPFEKDCAKTGGLRCCQIQLDSKPFQEAGDSIEFKKK
jgi:uncharacterized protein